MTHLISRVHDRKGREVGYIKDRAYYSVRYYHRNQIFKKPEYGNGMALDEFIIGEVLEPAGVIGLVFQVVGFEPQSFLCVVSLEDFMNKSIRINFDNINTDEYKKAGYRKQRMLPMNEWIRAYSDHQINRILLNMKVSTNGMDRSLRETESGITGKIE